MRLPLRDRAWRFSLRAGSDGGFRLRLKASNANTTSILGNCKAKISFLLRLDRLHRFFLNMRFNLSLPPLHGVRSGVPAVLRRLFCRRRLRGPGNGTHEINSVLAEVFLGTAGIGGRGGIRRFVGGFLLGFLAAMMFRPTSAVSGMADLFLQISKNWKW